MKSKDAIDAKISRVNSGRQKRMPCSIASLEAVMDARFFTLPLAENVRYA